MRTTKENHCHSSLCETLQSSKEKAGYRTAPKSALACITKAKAPKALSNTSEFEKWCIVHSPPWIHSLHFL